MSQLLKKMSLWSVVWWLLLSCLIATGCGKGAYDEKLDTAVQNAKAGIVKKKEISGKDDELTDAELAAKYAIDDEAEDEEEYDDEEDDFDDESDDGDDVDVEDEENPQPSGFFTRVFRRPFDAQ